MMSTHNDPHTQPGAQPQPGVDAQGSTYRVPGPQMAGTPMADPQASGFPGAGHPSTGPTGPSGYGGPGGYDSGAYGQGAYGSGGYGPGAYGPGNSGQKPPKRKKPLLKRWWFWIVLILVVVIIGSAISGGGDDSAENTESSAAVAEDETASGDNAKEEPAADKPAEEDAAASYGIGDVVAADDWEVAVNSVKDGVSSVGDEYMGAEAQGQFVTVNLSVKNTASAPDFFWEDNIKLGDEAGNTYSADSKAGLYADADSILFAEEINPGNTAKGVLVFDVPADVSPDKLTFEGGLFAEPIEISLG
ncbi:DUF4352 domain-containing protein [Brevibacterium aurantiacum]|nr:DUF4352 domain-containing protein [Brevibacterium aurantiacum]